jgi:hypothetical protein
LNRPTVRRVTARHAALQQLVRTFFDGSTELAAPALVQMSDNLSDTERARITREIEKAKGEDVLWLGVQASSLVLMAGAAALGLRPLPAAGRHGVWSVALVGILALPALPRSSPVQVPLGIAGVYLRQ